MSKVPPMTFVASDTPASDPSSLRDISDLRVFAPDPSTLERHAMVGFKNHDIRARPFNLLRTQVAKRITGEHTIVIGITSAAPDAGKSFLSLNLAAALANVAKYEVNLIDLDLRRGSIGEMLGMTLEVGISDYLDGTTNDLGSLGWRIDETRLAVFPTRPIARNSAELFAGARFSGMIGAFRGAAQKTIVLCDMPPAFANDDTMIAMQKLDGYFMVVDSGRTTRKQVQGTMEMLEPATCFGAILNRYNGGIIENYGYGYGSKAYERYY